MDTSKIIFENKPKSFARKTLITGLIYLVMLVVLYSILQATIILCIIPVVFIIDVTATELSFRTYDGWSLNNGELVLIRNTITGTKTKTIKYSEIEQISYVSGGGGSGSPRLIFQLVTGKTHGKIHCSIFQLADTLKYFQTKGIKIVLLEKDAEIQMYLDGKIDKIPMQNV